MDYLILGATGTLGREMISALLKRGDTKKIICLSRDEMKLTALQREVGDTRIETAIGDIRDKSSIREYFKGIDVVFHFAALKIIPAMEKHPLESIKTNLLGTVNAAECAIEYGVKNFVFSSTDKATRPVNTYGACKFLSEQMLFNYNHRNLTNFSVYRWVNVAASRGAVTYAFKDAIENNIPAHITHENMSRGFIRIGDAVNFVLETYQTKSNKVKIPEFKCAKVVDLLQSIGEVMGKPVDYVITGLREGEKLAEDIRYDFETGLCLSTDTAPQFSKEELLTLAREIVSA